MRPRGPGVPWRPHGVLIATEDGHKVLSVFVGVEPFDHGARPIVEVRLREDRPHEVGFRVIAAPGGKAMRSCILSATMGNYARLRRLYLKDRVEESRRIYEPLPVGLRGLCSTPTVGTATIFWYETALVIAARLPTSLIRPGPATAPMSLRHWHYQGVVATQYWRTRAWPGLVVRVNGRQTYWASTAPIPGGVAYENFELEVPFAPGQEFWFGVTAGFTGQSWVLPSSER